MLSMFRLRFNQLTEDRRLLQKGKEELTVRSILLWHIPMRGSWASKHTVPRIQIGPNTSFLPHLWPKASTNRDPPRTSKLCPEPQLGL